MKNLDKSETKEIIDNWKRESKVELMEKILLMPGLNSYAFQQTSKPVEII